MDIGEPIIRKDEIKIKIVRITAEVRLALRLLAWRLELANLVQTLTRAVCVKFTLMPWEKT